MRRKCFLCKLVNRNVILFGEKSLKTCIEVLENRKMHNLSHTGVQLPSTPNLYNGYHLKCYRNFTALMNKYKTKKADGSAIVEVVESEEKTESTISSIGNEKIQHEEQLIHGSSSNQNMAQGLHQPMSKICCFCDKGRKNKNGKIVSLSNFQDLDSLNAIKTKSLQIGDSTMVEKLNSISGAHSLFYHNTCKRQFLNQYRFKETSDEIDDWHISRKLGKIAFDEICQFISLNVLTESNSYYSTLLRDMYVNRLNIEFQNIGKSNEFEISVQKVEEKLLNQFGNKVDIIMVGNRNIVKSSNTIISDINAISDNDILERAAIILRKEILKIEPRKLSETITCKDLIAGECSIPEKIYRFYRSLLRTPRNNESSNCQRLIDSFSQDLIFAVTKGSIKTSKHICLGMAIKSLTSSKKVLNILNRYGHCCSYSVIEELETECTFSSTNRTQICPEDILRRPSLNTGLAFDNFDRYVETSSGKNTLHDTVGIIFQNFEDDTVSIEEPTIENSSNGSRKRRRTFDAISHEMSSYSKKPRVVETLQSLDSNLRNIETRDKINLEQLNVVWMFSHALEIPDTPMWVGFHSLIYQDESCKQKISYVTTINSSPTNKEVVFETMIQSQKVREECGEKYMQVSYDLAIEKVALAIQAAERPRFNDLFIHLGAFHIEMAYFHGIGKFIDNCGITTILVQAEILANGSVSGFITGKHFNRCKKLHPLISLAFQILHFKQFLSKFEFEITEPILNYLVNFTKVSSPNPTVDDGETISLMEKYQEYCNKTLAGQHGKTAQFYMIYINLIDHYLTLNYSIRTGDFELFKYILPKITNLFFVMNQPNYARWLTKYHDNLIKVEETHPGLELSLKTGSFGVKRTSKPFSRQPIDLTLEQTINADAAGSLTGVSHFTNSISARQRWCKSHSIRTTIISYVLETTGLKKYQYVTADLQKHNIDHATSQIKKIFATVTQSINPFDTSLDANELFNISNGKATPTSVADFLINIESKGNHLREKFILECTNDNTRFEKTIKQTKILNFNDTLKKKKVTIAGKVQELKIQRDLFGRLLGVALEQKIDLKKVLEYPLTPVPLSLCHIDGTLCKTDKSILLKTLESSISSNSPQHIDVVIIDGFFILHSLTEAPLTFGNISRKLLVIFMQYKASEIHIIFDRYFFPSIKSSERDLRQAVDEVRYNISGPGQKRSTNFSYDLKNIRFKEALVNFLIQDWSNNHYKDIIGKKVLYVNYDCCYKYKVNSEEMIEKTVEENFSCEEHEEADTKIVFHLCNINHQQMNVVIRCSDTDILVIVLGNMSYSEKTNAVFMDVGTGNSRRFIDVSLLYNNVGNLFCKALPGFHALTGCDYNPAFFRKGKKKPYNVLLSDEKYQNAFMKLASMNEQNSSEIFSIIEEFVCRMYGELKINDINEARYAIFVKNFKAKNVDETFTKKIVNCDASSFPPCRSELRQQILRAFHIASIWSNAHKVHPTNSDPNQNGWKNVNDKYELNWFEGDQLPIFVNEVIIQEEGESDSNDEYGTDEEDEEESHTDFENTF